MECNKRASNNNRPLARSSLDEPARYARLPVLGPSETRQDKMTSNQKQGSSLDHGSHRNQQITRLRGVCRDARI